MKKLFVVMLAFAIVCAFAGCSIAEKEILITAQNSPDGNYKVLLYQVGEPTWSFGSVSAKLVLENSDGKKIEEACFELANDGGGVSSGNIIAINWVDTQVAVQMKESDTTKQYTYMLQYGK